jgi:hypothetical protein
MLVVAPIGPFGGGNAYRLARFVGMVLTPAQADWPLSMRSIRAKTQCLAHRAGIMTDFGGKNPLSADIIQDRGGIGGL